jgi:hypothetical protein
VSQSYHCIDPSTFEYRICALDFIYCPVPKYGPVLCAALVERQEYWTSGMNPEPIAAGGIADAASNMQAGGKSIWGEEKEGGE